MQSILISSTDKFQKNALKTLPQLGFQNQESYVIYGLIVGMRNLVTSAQMQDSVLLHKHMGICSWYLANYCNAHNIKLSSCITMRYEDMEFHIADRDMEYFIDQFRLEKSFEVELTSADRYDFVRRVWIAIFPMEYHNDFIKIDRIFNTNIEDNRIKYPEKFE